MAIFDVDGVEEIIGYTFKDKMLLRKCFTHSSYANEHGEEDNERLEFFGDAILEFVVTEYLMKKFSGDEGKLTDKRQQIVCDEFLLKTVNKLNIDDYVLLGKGQVKSSSGGEKLFASVYEAVIAGIYIDGGMANAKKFIKNTLINTFEKQNDKLKNKISSDAKNEYQEYVQKRHMGSVGYETLGKTGPDHLPQFRVAALLNGKQIAEGVGSSKKTAESVAADCALKILKSEAGK